MQDYDTPQFARNIVKLRKRHNMIQKQVSALTGIPLPVLRMMERGELLPAADHPHLLSLCELFSLTPEQLLSDDAP